MNKLKDIFYDKSDILVAILIFAVAFGIIFWRINAIMDYPKKLVSGSDSHIVTDVDISNQQQQDEHEQQSEMQNQNQQDKDDPFANAGTTNDDSDKKEPNTQSNSTSIWRDGKLTQSVTVEVNGNTALSAINCLVSAGLFDSYSEYESLCKSLGYNPEQVYAGSFTFQEGSTKEIIVNKVNLGN